MSDVLPEADRPATVGGRVAESGAHRFGSDQSPVTNGRGWVARRCVRKKIPFRGGRPPGCVLCGRWDGVCLSRQDSQIRPRPAGGEYKFCGKEEAQGPEAVCAT